MTTWIRSAALVVIAALMAACQPMRTAPPAKGEIAFPASEYRTAAAAGHRVYDLIPGSSTLRVFVYRAGALARFGHDHVVVASDFRGAVAWPSQEPGKARLDLVVPVGALKVDPPAVRRALGGAFASELDRDAVEGTRENMLGAQVLDAERFPRVGIHLVGVEGGLPRPILKLAVSLRGSQKTVSVPVAVAMDGDKLQASGRLVLRQSDFGMEPFSALGGALTVSDAVTVEFDLVGRRR